MLFCANYREEAAIQDFINRMYNVQSTCVQIRWWQRYGILSTAVAMPGCLPPPIPLVPLVPLVHLIPLVPLVAYILYLLWRTSYTSCTSCTSTSLFASSAACQHLQHCHCPLQSHPQCHCHLHYPKTLLVHIF